MNSEEIKLLQYIAIEKLFTKTYLTAQKKIEIEVLQTL